MGSSDYLIVRPEKAGWLDLLHLLIFRPRLSECEFIDMSVSHDAKLYDQPPFLMVLSLVLQKFFLLIEKPLRIFGHVVEFPFNLVFVNGGLFGLLLKIITCKNRDSGRLTGYIDKKSMIILSSVVLLLHLYKVYQQ